MSIKIITDTGSQILPSTNTNENLIVLSMPVMSSDTEYIEGKDIFAKEMFSRMKEGEVFKTSQVPYNVYYETFKRELENGNDIIYISLSSGITSTFQTATMAKNDLLSENKDYNIVVKDSFSVCSGLTSIINKTLKLVDLNYSFDEICNKLDDIIKSQQVIFTVTDLEYLYRGGRLSRLQKTMGSFLSIRPILHVNKDDGKLYVVDKARGDKQTYLKVKNLIKQKCDGNVNTNQTVYFCYGENEESMDAFIDKIQSDFNFKKVVKLPLGCVIGAHSGPDLISIFFSSYDLGEELSDV